MGEVNNCNVLSLNPRFKAKNKIYLAYLLTTGYEKHGVTVMNKTEKAMFSWDFHSIWEMAKDNKHNKKNQVMMRISIETLDI